MYIYTIYIYILYIFVYIAFYISTYAGVITRS